MSMNFLLLSLIAAILLLAGGSALVILTIDDDPMVYLFGAVVLTVLLTLGVYWCASFAWRYEHVLLGFVTPTAVPEGTTRIFGSGTSAMLYEMHNGQWIPSNGGQ